MFSLFENCYVWLKTRKEPLRKITLISVGLDDAGKSTTLASLQGEPPDGITPTLGFANTELTLKQCDVTIYDLGGGPRVRSIWKNYYAEVYGILFVIDSCDKARLEDVRDVLADVTSHPYTVGKPVLLLANKQDRADAASLEEIKSEIHLDELAMKNEFEHSMVACSAVKGYGKGIDKTILQGIYWLLSAIRKNLVNLAPRVDRDSAVQREKDEHERMRKREEAKRLREEREQREKEAGTYNEDPCDEEDGDPAVHNPFMPIKDHIKTVEAKQDNDKTTKKKKKKKSRNDNEYLRNRSVPSIAIQPASPEVDSHIDRQMDDSDSDDVVQVTVHRKVKSEAKTVQWSADNDTHQTENDTHCNGTPQPRIMRKQENFAEERDDMPINPKPKKKKRLKRKGNKTAPLDTQSDGDDKWQEGELAGSHSARSLPPLRIGRGTKSNTDLPGMEPLPFQTNRSLPAWASPRPNSEEVDAVM